MPGYSDGCKHLGERDGDAVWCKLKQRMGIYLRLQFEILRNI